MSNAVFPPPTLEACEEILTIPGSGLIQSLNVAATAAILLHALTGADGSRAPDPVGGRAG